MTGPASAGYRTLFSGKLSFLLVLSVVYYKSNAETGLVYLDIRNHKGCRAVAQWYCHYCLI